MKKYSYHICLQGLNFDRLFEKFKELNVKIFNVERPNYKVCEFGVGFFDYLKIKKQNLLKNYKVQIKKTFNFGFIANNFLKNIGLYLGIIVSIIFCFAISNVTLKIDVQGLEKLNKEELIAQLEQINVKTNKVNSISNEEIEQFLKQNNNQISLVSVIKKGTNLIINVKEKVDVSIDISPICAGYNMLIENIVVSQGVAKVKKGDIVKKGDVLVDPQIVFTNGQKTELEPIAKIDAKVWIIGSIEFNEEEIIYQKTGKKIVNSTYEWCGTKIFSNTSQVKFENYEKKVYNDYVFNNMFLPIKLNKTIYYETQPVIVKDNFEDNRVVLTEKSKVIAYSKLPNGVKVENENTIISNVGKTYYVTTYLQINLKIEG